MFRKNATNPAKWCILNEVCNYFEIFIPANPEIYNHEGT